MDIDRFRHEHVELFAAVTVLRGLVQRGIVENAGAIHQKLVMISALIKLHLAAEDRMLYPALLRAADPVVTQTSERFQQEMGGLAAAYVAFAAKWSVTSRIVADPQGFRDAANGVFKVLHERVQRENRELYPMAERL
ncbi:MAG TPA: hemerythrin domain-containing protein [Rhodanobacter sp.]|nr:hemerythrin domain-containing protein [Rhodanobacter sp.]